MRETGIHLGLTIGDPAGIGPEITASLLGPEAGRDNDGRVPGPTSGRGLGLSPEIRERLVLIGSASSLRHHLDPAVYSAIDIIAAEEDISAAEFASSWKAPGRLTIVDTGGDREVPSGRPSREGGLVAGRAIEIAAALAGNGSIDGIVTGPISKEGLRLAGYPWNGHTSMLADLMHSPDCQMMMVSGEMRVVILTRDIPLKDVPEAVTKEKIITGVKVTARALSSYWGIERPRILVSALNPHAGDGGVTGKEEIEKIIPAIEKLKSEGFDVTGPIPADTLFCGWKEKRADAFVALYHDLGMIPFKISGFSGGVNMTTGLPVVRTSVCHGTAYDIAGKAIAESGSLASAVRLAYECAVTQQKTVETL